MNPVLDDFGSHSGVGQVIPNKWFPEKCGYDPERSEP